MVPLKKCCKHSHTSYATFEFRTGNVLHNEGFHPREQPGDTAISSRGHSKIGKTLAIPRQLTGSYDIVKLGAMLAVSAAERQRPHSAVQLFGLPDSTAAWRGQLRVTACVGSGDAHLRLSYEYAYGGPFNDRSCPSGYQINSPGGRCRARSPFELWASFFITLRTFYLPAFSNHQSVFRRLRETGMAQA